MYTDIAERDRQRSKAYLSAGRGLDALVVALCSDYERREEVIKNKSASYRVIMTYRFINYKILDAASSIAGTRDSLDFIREIGERGGYTKTEISLGERAYKITKLAVKVEIAKRLGLIDAFEELDFS